jgi:hypothetical protein
MKQIVAVISLITIIGFCRLSAQTEAEQKAWQAYMTPSDVHKMIAESDGEWNLDITMWMDPKAPPTKSHCHLQKRNDHGWPLPIIKNNRVIMMGDCL